MCIVGKLYRPKNREVSTSKFRVKKHKKIWDEVLVENPCTWICYLPKPDVGKSQLLLSAVVCDDSIFQVSGCKVSSSKSSPCFFFQLVFLPL